MDIRKYFKEVPESASKNTISFQEKKEEYLAIYTDGSTFNNGSKKKKVYGGIGVFFAPNDERNISESVTNESFPQNEDLQVSNNTCELLAIIKGIEYLIKLSIEA